MQWAYGMMAVVLAMCTNQGILHLIYRKFKLSEEDQSSLFAMTVGSTTFIYLLVIATTASMGISFVHGLVLGAVISVPFFWFVAFAFWLLYWLIV